MSERFIQEPLRDLVTTARLAREEVVIRNRRLREEVDKLMAITCVPPTMNRTEPPHDLSSHTCHRHCPECHNSPYEKLVPRPLNFRRRDSLTQSTDEDIFHKHCPAAEPTGNDALQPESDESAEEWDRFEALHDDPYKVQRRDKCNLKYEDKAELVWEKGGSGLVFHTDERTWRKLDPLRKEELFDEPGSFDWDINMEPYEVPTELSVGPTPTGHWGVSRDTSDLIDIQISNEGTERPHPSLDADSVYRQEICEKGYGQCLMQRMGWKPGLRLGLSSSRGLLSPIDTKGSLPPCTRTGLGYYGPRITKHSFAAPNTSGSAAVRTVYIRSLFDSSAYAASRSDHGHALSLLRRNDPDEVIKYRSYPSITTPQQSTSTTCVACSSVPSLTRTIILNSRSNMSKEGIAFVSGGLLAKN